jgi:hypothetical protein
VDHREIAGRFNARVGRRAGTLLVGGAAEPLYLPAGGRRPAIIRYTRDYARSALHEIAHWCRADPRRRSQVDYGLWYQPPPRPAAMQARFFAAEVPVQALEMLLAEACGLAFHFSADNPGAADGAERCAFEQRVRQRFARLCAGVPDATTGAVLDALNPGWPELAAAALARCRAGAHP